MEVTDRRGKVFQVDAEDWKVLSKHVWNVYKVGKKSYVLTRLRDDDGKWKAVYMHRLLLAPPPHMEVDHINSDSTDNRQANLRLATRRENCMNVAKQPGCTSQYRGVSWCKRLGRWEAYIHIHRKKIAIGTFANETDAAFAYDAKARELYREFARFNFPEAHEQPA